MTTHCVKNGDNRGGAHSKFSGERWRGALEVTRRKSNCLTVLKVLEMICDLFQVCALEGGEGGQDACSEREREGQEREMTVANVHFMAAVGSRLDAAKKCGMKWKVEQLRDNLV